jgi:hypothetical protein
MSITTMQIGGALARRGSASEEEEHAVDLSGLLMFMVLSKVISAVYQDVGASFSRCRRRDLRLARINNDYRIGFGCRRRYHRSLVGILFMAGSDARPHPNWRIQVWDSLDQINQNSSLCSNHLFKLLLICKLLSSISFE